MILTVTLTPQRSTPRKYVRMVAYRRNVDKYGTRSIVPYQLMEDADGRIAVEQLGWRNIARTNEVDPEFEQAWREHVRQQSAPPA